MSTFRDPDDKGPANTKTPEKKLDDNIHSGIIGAFIVLVLVLAFTLLFVDPFTIFGKTDEIAAKSKIAMLVYLIAAGCALIPIIFF